MCPPTITRASPTTTSSDERRPTVAAASLHQDNNTSHDSRLPTSARIGSEAAALSMNSAALRIASRNARPQRPVDAREPLARYSRSARLRISTTPPPASGCSGRPRRRASCGTPRYSAAKAA
ncbi:MAG: hypothetical protein A3J29_21080 [Acidobacteria bacterium RIFCSPLOWO2_12_FULL_67_14b]|nr:MAG: hypothetical protein A3J29_21080 [Acidobacteria bacterium RIFCSPLOWO2_12_FULL_67_14b]